MKTEQVDALGRGWFPREGNKIYHRNMMRYGFVVSVHQTADAPATITVVLEPDDEDAAATPWQHLECEVDEIERDTRDDFDPREFASILQSLSLREAGVLVLENLAFLASARAEVRSLEDLSGALLRKANAARFSATARAAAGQYEESELEAKRADDLRSMAAAAELVLRGPAEGSADEP